MDPKQLELMDNDNFRNLVGEDVRGNVDIRTSKLLRTQPFQRRWHDVLCQIKRNVEFQLASDKAERYSQRLKFMAEGTEGKQKYAIYIAGRERWRANNIFFKNGVENKIAEAKRLLHNDEILLQRLGELQAAIRSHRHIVEHGTDAEALEADTLLWEVLDG